MRRSSHVALAFAAAVGGLVLGCSPSTAPEPVPPAGCTLAYLGDKNAAAKLEVLVRGTSGKSSALRDGDAVPMIYPPQGGRVVFIGARATNLDPCGVKLSGALRDVSTGQVRIDNRTVNLAPGVDGWGMSLEADIASFSNVPVCPNSWASTDLMDHVFDLTVTVADRSGHVATQTLHVTPGCAEPERAAECRCICKHGYVLGEACDGDAGASDAAGDAAADGSTDGGGGDGSLADTEGAGG